MGTYKTSRHGAHCDSEHTVEVGPAWAERQRVLLELNGGGDLSHQALVQVICEAVMLAKREADRERETLQPSVSCPRRHLRENPGCQG